MNEIIFSEHATEKMRQRGATEAEVILTIEEGDEEPARKNRTMYKRNFPFDKEWSGTHYRIKQVAPVVVRDGATLVVVTVYVFYF